MITIEKEKSDMEYVLNELQEIQRAFLFEVPLCISIVYLDKSMYIHTGVPVQCKSKNPLAAYAEVWRFESFRDVQDFKDMLDEIRKKMIEIKANKSLLSF